MSDELMSLLERAFAGNAVAYGARGFQGRVGYGQRPALLHIDLANAWTRPGSPFTCDEVDERIIPAVQRLNAAARTSGVPIIYTTTAYEQVDGPASDVGLWGRKLPLAALRAGSEAVAIDDRIAPGPADLVITKKRASAFHGTNLSSLLTAQGIDTVIVTGVTMAGCVRHTVEDAISEGFRPIVVREAVGDRVAGVVAWNLFDIDAKFGDVEPVAAVEAYLGRCGQVGGDARGVPAAAA